MEKSKNMKSNFNIKLIEDYIKEHKLNKVDFCRACQISVYSLGKIYKGNTKSTTLIKIVQYMHIRLKDFIGI
ncbi:MAG: hypothetical protein IJZ62_01560 [Clostridia bacterium]|nr:hypothetical protein [Clostridia bacterium]